MAATATIAGTTGGRLPNTTLLDPRKRPPLLLRLIPLLVVAWVLLLLLSIVPVAARAASADYSAGADKKNHDDPVEVDVDNDDGMTRTRYCLIGVSGTLQDGFPLRPHLDYYHHHHHHPYREATPNATLNGDSDTSSSSSAAPMATTPALFLGRALVRGVKAYLDVKDAGWREHVPEPHLPRLPNAVVLATGCYEHANLYHLYAVDERQVWHILANEPRFLAITPDTGLIDLMAPETDAGPLLRALVEHTDATNPTPRPVEGSVEAANVPLVLGVWYHHTYIESPAAYVQSDGTHVTSFETSLAQWAGVVLQDLMGTTVSSSSDGSPTCSAGSSTGTTTTATTLGNNATVDAWDRVALATRQAEAVAAAAEAETAAKAATGVAENNIQFSLPRQQQQQQQQQQHTYAPTHECQRRTRLGAGPNDPRFNAPIPAQILLRALRDHPPPKVGATRMP